MTKVFARKLFSGIFLFIFFAKMIISVAPLLADHLGSDFVRSVILQLEIEGHSSKNTEAKETVEKAELLNGVSKFTFSRPTVPTTLNKYFLKGERLIQAFYPSVPTPPPNC